MYHILFVTVIFAMAMANVMTTQTVGSLPRNISFNKYMSFEAGDFKEFEWGVFVFYISYVDELFGDYEPLIDVTISGNLSVKKTCVCSYDNVVTGQTRMYKNVQTFGVHIERMGVYELKIDPVNEVEMGNATNPVDLVLSLTLRVQINYDDQRCNLAGKFQFNDKDANSDVFPQIQIFSLRNWTKVTLLKHSCNTWIGKRPKWTFEKITQKLYVYVAHSCLNEEKIQLVNLADYTSQIVPIRLPAPSSESGFIIQPYTIPPGSYRMCNTVSNNIYVIKRCAFLDVDAEESDCTTSTRRVRIHMIPDHQEFTWPLRDLTIIVVQHYSVYGIYDAGNTDRIFNWYKWTCSGDVLCQSLKEGRKVLNTNGTKTENTQSFYGVNRLHIPAAYMTPGTSIIVRFIVEYQQQLNNFLVCQDFEERNITFVHSMFANAAIRCYINCWHMVNPDTPLLVGVDCDGCKFGRKANPHITWSISGLPMGAKMVGQNTPYILVTNTGITDYYKFMVRVTVSYVSVDGHTEEIKLGKKFTVHRTFSPVVALAQKDFTESQESIAANPAELLAMFPRYSFSLDKLFYIVRRVMRSPMITTISVVPGTGNADPRNNIQTAKPDDFCTKSCGYKHKWLVNGNYPHCTDCNKFITCSSGKLKVTVCPPGESYDFLHDICRPGMRYCLQNQIIGDETSNLSPLEDYAIIRTLWAPVDVCIESFEDNTATEYSVSIEMSTAHGLNKINLTNNVFPIPRNIPEIDSGTDLKSLWEKIRDSQNFSINDQTYVMVIARAIEAQAKKYSKVSARSAKISEDVNVNVTSGTPISSMIKARTKAAADSRPLSDVVEAILDFMLSEDENELSYTNINIYLVCLIKMLSIRDYTLPVLAKAIDVLEKAQDLHPDTFLDLVSEDNIIRLKLEVIDALIVYYVGYVQKYSTDFQTHIYASSIVSATYNALDIIPKGLPLRYPSEKTFTSKNYIVTAFWLDPFQQSDNIITELNDSVLTIDIYGLQSTFLFDFNLNTFINVAAHISDKAALLGRVINDVPSAQMLHISVTKKQSTSLPLTLSVPGLYQIQYPFDINVISQSTHYLKFGIYAKKLKKNIIYDSDCTFFRIEATTKYGSIITITPNEKLILGLRIGLSNRLSVGLKTINSDEITLPREAVTNADCKVNAPSPYSIFLPAVNRRQRSQMSGRIEYYIIISIKKNQTYNGHRLDAGPIGLLDIGGVVIKLICVRLGCFRLENFKLTNKDCMVSSCSLNVSSFINCRCDEGQTFTADTKPCYIRWFNINRDTLTNIDVTVEKMELMIPTVITSLWFISLIVVMKARRWDLLERPLGKILLLEGVFSPFCNQHYLVCFSTGFLRNCGTKSIPFMTIIGTDNISPRYKLETWDYVFLRGSEIWLLVSAPVDLGKPRRVVLSLEPEYSHFTHISPWFVKEVYIKDMSSGYECTCHFHTWIECNSTFNLPFVVEEVTMRQGNRKRAFGDILLRLLRNRHPLFGIFNNVPGSNFTKVQHAIVSFCGLLILMLICLHVHKLPLPSLRGDYEEHDDFQLDVELFVKTALCALLAMLPIFIIEIFFENARRHYSPNVMWTHSIRRVAFHKQENVNMSSVDSEKDESEVDFYSVKSYKTLTVSMNSVFKPLSQESSDEGPQDKELSSRCWLVRTIPNCISAIFSWPISFCLLLTIVITVSISYYLFMLGLHINLFNSLQYLYTVCVSYAILMVVMYPLLLVVVAALNTVFYVYGKSYYGVRRETEYRVKSVYAALPGLTKLANLYTFETRIRTLGNTRDRVLSRTMLCRSYNWCKQLLMGRKVVKSGHIRHTTLETVLFTIVALLVINVEVGSVNRNFMQTHFVAQSLRLSTGMDDADNALTVDYVWDHLLNLFSTFHSWRSESSMTSFLVLCAVQVRQIRAVPLEDDCHETEPFPLPPKCHEDIEHSQIETRSFANSWDLPIPRKIITSKPYTYDEREYFTNTITASHHYSGGGYYVLVPGWDKLPSVLIELRNSTWFDDNTKAVIINLNLLNVDSGLLTIVENVYEFRLAGIFMYTSDLYTFPLELTGVYEIVMSNLIIIFALMTVYFLIFEIRACFNMGFVTYFTHPQSWFLLVERCMSIAVLVIFFGLQNDKYNKVIQVSDAYLTETEDEEFIDFESITHLKLFLILASSLLVGTCLVKTMHLLTAYELMAKFVEMVPGMITFLYIPAICIIGYALLGFILFHTHLKYYNGFYASLYTVTLMLLDTAAIKPTTDAYEYEGKLFCVALYCIMYYIILNYFITLLNEIYSEHKRQSRLKASKQLEASNVLY